MRQAQRSVSCYYFDRKPQRAKCLASFHGKFWNDFNVRPFLGDYRKLSKAKDKFLRLLEEAVKEIVDEFVEECNVTKVK